LGELLCKVLRQRSGEGDALALLAGANNSAANATYTQFCDALPQANGSFFAFDDIGTGNPGTCPVVP
jgi:hypothetical protein